MVYLIVKSGLWKPLVMYVNYSRNGNNTTQYMMSCNHIAFDLYCCWWYFQFMSWMPAKSC